MISYKGHHEGTKFIFTETLKPGEESLRRTMLRDHVYMVLDGSVTITFVEFDEELKQWTSREDGQEARLTSTFCDSFYVQADHFHDLKAGEDGATLLVIDYHGKEHYQPTKG